MEQERAPNERPKNRSLRPDEELGAAAYHVNYEMWMFRQCDDWLRQHPQDIAGSIFNAVLTSYTIHLRTLNGFFYPKKNEWSNPDNILARDFIPENVDWQPPPQPRTITDRITAVPKLAAHLTYSRSAVEKDWKIRELTPAMVTLIWDFFQALPPDRCGWFEQSLNAEYWANADRLRLPALELSSPATAFDALTLRAPEPSTNLSTATEFSIDGSEFISSGFTSTVSQDDTIVVERKRT